MCLVAERLPGILGRSLTIFQSAITVSTRVVGFVSLRNNRFSSPLMASTELKLPYNSPKCCDGVDQTTMKVTQNLMRGGSNYGKSYSQ